MSAVTSELAAHSGLAGGAVRDRVVAGAGRRRAAVAALLLATAVAYLWGLSRNGYANEYYAAAVQAGSSGWKAWFFGSLDSSNFITVDKTPASLWVMGLSARIFGFGIWSMLVPQALMGVATVGLLYASVRRWFGTAAGLVAGGVLALTPVAVLMFRFNNPDALLVLLLVAGAYAVTRAIDSVRRPGWWLALAGLLVGTAFLTKMLQAFLVLPAFGLAYLLAGRPGLLRRLGHSMGALAAMVVGGGWWVAVVELMPASARPYIGGSQNNSVLELTLGYNGLGRLTGDETGSVGGRGGWGGETGMLRLFNDEMAGQASWLLPAALLSVLALVVLAGRAPRTDRTRAFAVLWGGWLLVTAGVFSFMAGIFHSYYLIALAPAIGALVGAAAAALWQRRDRWQSRVALAAGTALTAVVGYALLARTPDWHPWLRYVVLAAGPIAVLAILAGQLAPVKRLARVAPVVAVLAMLVAGLAGPAAYAASTISAAHAGALPSAGPAITGAGPGGMPRAMRGGPRGFIGPGAQGDGGGQVGPAPDGQGAGPGTQGGQGGSRGGAGGFLGGGGISGVSSELVALLQRDADNYTWAAAAVTANGAAPLQIASGVPVMAIGGFNGTDPSPSLAEFQQLVAQGKIHYFVASGGGRGGPGGGGTSSEISEWVQSTYAAQTVGTQTVYDLTAG